MSWRYYLLLFCLLTGITVLYGSQTEKISPKEYSVELYGDRGLEQKNICVVKKRKPIWEQLTRDNTRYVIKHNYNLHGQTILVPDNSILEFRGGSLENGSLVGNFSIVSAPRQVFKNVELPLFSTHALDFRWFVGDERKITQALLEKLPSVPIFFGHETYYSEEEIDLSGIDYIEYHDLILHYSHSLKAYSRTIAGGLGGKKNNNNNECKYISPNTIKTYSYSLKELEGKLISIRTADCTLHDSRPLSKDTETNTKGNPTLFKGLTTVVKGIDGNIIELLDSIGSFSASRSYSYQESNRVITNDPIYSTWAIYQPKHINYYNCEFVGTERNVGIYISGKDIIIDGCSFISNKGSDVILSINNSRGGYIRNCTVEGAWAGGNTSTNYGIQVNSSTSIIIDRCTFRNNRRAVDFSGEFESRYCTVSRCFITGNDKEYHSGSALGGHSTSFGNSYLNNRIEGQFQIGIQCRGEQELIEGNIIDAFCNGAIFATSFNTIVRNNKAYSGQWGRNHTAFHIGNYGFTSTVIIEGNDIEIEDRFLHAYNPQVTSFIVRNNKIKCNQNSSTQVTYIAPSGFSGVFERNDILTTEGKNKVVDIPKDK